MMLRKCSILFFLFGFIFLHAQVKVSGVVKDEYGDEASYADIFFKGTNEGTYTNSDGSFYLESDQTYSEIEVSLFGYESKTIKIKPGANYDLNIILKEEPLEDETIQLDGLVAQTELKKYKKKKENPAYTIMRELWKRKRKNGLKKFPHYQYEEYEKIQFDINNIDSTIIDRKVMKGFEFVFQNIDTSSVTGSAYLPLFLNEAMYKVYGRNEPSRKFRRDLVANKTSGFEDNDIVTNTVKNLYKEFDIYENRINFFNKAFVSPLARDGFSVYDYQLIDTTEVKDKSCYRIKYFPKRDSELTFKGDFCVDSASYAVSEIMMQSTKGINVNFVKDIYVELEYDLPSDSVFLPSREYYMIDMSLFTKKRKAKGMFAHRTVSYEKYDFETPQDDKFYSEKWDPYTEGAFEKDTTYWSMARHEQLNKDQKNIYLTLDSLAQVPKFKRIVKGVETLASGYYNIYDAIDIGNLYTTFGFNDVEGARLRAGARTFFSRNDIWRAAFYTAYGFKDKQLKYGAELRYMFNKYNRFMMGIGTKRDIEQLGAQLTLSEGIMTRSFASSSILGTGANDKLSSVNKTNFFAAIDPWKDVTFRLDLTTSTIKSANPTEFTIDYIDREGIQKNDLTDTRASFSISARPGAKYSRYGIDRYEHSSLAPTIMLRYTHGFKGFMDSDINYDRLQFYFYNPTLIGSFGRADITFEAGKTFQAVPLSLLSVIPGNQSYGYVPGTFSQLDYYEFVTDSYASLVWDHHFNGRLTSRIPVIKKWKLRTVAFFRGAWGDISDKSKDINRSNVLYSAPHDKIYYEYGFGVENIGFGNIRPLRVNFNFRGNYNYIPDARPFGITVGMDFSF